MVRFIVNAIVSFFTFVVILFLFYIITAFTALQSSTVQRVHLIPSEGVILYPEEFMKMNNELREKYNIEIVFNGEYYEAVEIKGNTRKLIKQMDPNVRYCGTEISGRRYTIDDRCEVGFLTLFQFIYDDFRYDLGAKPEIKGFKEHTWNFISKLLPIYRIEQFIKNYEKGYIKQTHPDNMRYYYMLSDIYGRVNPSIYFAYITVVLTIILTIIFMRKSWITVKNEGGENVIDAQELRRSYILSGFGIPGLGKTRRRKKKKK